MGGLRYCFESSYVPSALSRTSRHGLAVVDTDGCESFIIHRR